MTLRVFGADAYLVWGLRLSFLLQFFFPLGSLAIIDVKGQKFLLSLGGYFHI